MNLEVKKSYYQFDIPILFIIFKRLDTVKRVFEQIKKIKPQKLYIAQDGPEENNNEQTKRFEIVRNYVLNNIDWECEIKTLFRKRKLGCGKAVSEAITWFFDNEPAGIIIEHDVVPTLSFFSFCKILLEKFKDEKRIWHIGGSPFYDKIKIQNGDYFFSALSMGCGWATWADRWKYYDFEMKNISDDSFISNYWRGLNRIYWKKIFLKMKNKEIDTWDYQWLFTIWSHAGLSILPKFNLTEHIGFGEEATFVKKYPFKFNIIVKELSIKEHPIFISRNYNADNILMKNVFLPKKLRGFIGLITYGTKIGKILQKIGLAKF